MRQSVLILGAVIGSLVALVLYSIALIDWVQDYKTGVYTENQLEAVLESAAILVYSYAGFEFFRRRVTL